MSVYSYLSKFENAQQLDVNLKNIKQNIEGLFLMHYKDICYVL